MKVCSKCKAEKDDSYFDKATKTKDGLFNYCKVCRLSYNKERSETGKYSGRYIDVVQKIDNDIYSEHEERIFKRYTELGTSTKVARFYNIPVGHVRDVVNKVKSQERLSLKPDSKDEHHEHFEQDEHDYFHYHFIDSIIRERQTVDEYDFGENDKLKTDTIKRKLCKRVVFCVTAIKEHCAHVKKVLSKEGLFGIKKYHPVHGFNKVRYPSKALCLNSDYCIITLQC